MRRFAFCIWDGARLATEAEWEYAAGNGSNNQKYPWGNAPEPTNEYAVFNGQWDGDPDWDFADIAPVGSAQKGNGHWGHSDLAGSMWEWVFDYHADPYADSCDNCANATPGSERVVRGGGFYSGASRLVASNRDFYTPSGRDMGIGFRCVRNIR